MTQLNYWMNKKRKNLMPVLTDLAGNIYQTPLFLPVYKYGDAPISIHRLKEEFGINSIITNAFFLYRNKELRNQAIEKGIHDLMSFDGLIMTDSGAFQQFHGPLYLSPKKIVKFQDDIGADIISPLDVITSPGDNRTTAQKKLNATNKRIQEALQIANRSLLAGVQQGGRFPELREEALKRLMELDVQYVALGSLVPFFTKDHKIDFVGKMIKQARYIISSPEIPIHLYGAGDPLEIPFYVALGCDIFDSSSFYHYGIGNWYMTPYGAINTSEIDELSMYKCDCVICQSYSWKRIRESQNLLIEHNLWTILKVFHQLKLLKENPDSYQQYLDHILDTHDEWFPNSEFRKSWYTALNWSPE